MGKMLCFYHWELISTGPNHEDQCNDDLSHFWPISRKGCAFRRPSGARYDVLGSSAIPVALGDCNTVLADARVPDKRYGQCQVVNIPQVCCVTAIRQHLT